MRVAGHPHACGRRLSHNYRNLVRLSYRNQVFPDIRTVWTDEKVHVILLGKLVILANRKVVLGLIIVPDYRDGMVNAATVGTPAEGIHVTLECDDEVSVVAIARNKDRRLRYSY